MSKYKEMTEKEKEEAWPILLEYMKHHKPMECPIEQVESAPYPPPKKKKRKNKC